MIPTTTAFMPSSARYTVAYFFMLCQIGKKNNTSNALGKKMAIDPMAHPANCIYGPPSFIAIPPVNAAIENTGPGIARTIPAPV